MEKLEQYLDQVCRRMGGPWAMRQHVRQELREHLLDAVAQHKAAGMTEADALTKALDEFGRPDEVRSELEATHGQRMNWILDKAMQWKEMTMKAKWFWASWTYVGLVGVIVLQALFITFNVLFIIPKFHKLMHDGIIDPTIAEDGETRWMVDYLNTLSYVAGHYTLVLILVSLAAWGLFEWRVKSENKSFIRLSALGTAAVALTIVVILMAGSLVITFCLGVPAMSRMARPWAEQQVTTIDTSIIALEQALAKKDWKAMQEPATNASTALNRLFAGPAIPSLTTGQERPTAHELRTDLKNARAWFSAVQQAIQAEDAGRVDAELRRFRKDFEPLREAAKKPPR